MLFFVVSVCQPGGLWTCQEKVDCVGRCVVSGDPHYRTFDGLHYTYIGQCDYVLVQPAIGYNMDTLVSIRIGNQFCSTSSTQMCPRVVTFVAVSSTGSTTIE